MLDSPWFRVAVILFTAFVLIPLFWCLVVWMLSRASGWGRLARTYESNRRFEGATSRWQSARIGLISYNRVLTFTQMEDGLGLTPMPLFSAGHPPLFIPWKAISYGGRKRSFFANMDLLQVGDEKPVPFLISPGSIYLARLEVEAPLSAPELSS
jgi:hypothetical protein